MDEKIEAIRNKLKVSLDSLTEGQIRGQFVRCFGPDFDKEDDDDLEPMREEDIPPELRRFVYTRSDFLADAKPKDPVKKAAFEKRILELQKQFEEEDRLVAASAAPEESNANRADEQ